MQSDFLNDGSFRLGAILSEGGVSFSAWSGAASRIWVSIFDDNGATEVARHELQAAENGVFSTDIAGLGEGARYGFRADGLYNPASGLWFDPEKLLLDPYAVEIDRPFAYDKTLTLGRGECPDTAGLMPKATVVETKPMSRQKPVFERGGLVYELNVRGFTMLHPEIAPQMRGTVGALAHPAILAHLKKLGVSAVELMPITAWIDERHLGPLGLSNAWGYNPVGFMALDPRLVPGGLAELQCTVQALRDEGIGVILDLVFNHTGESDIYGPTLSLRGLDGQAYFRRFGGRLANETGTGNTIACDHPAAGRLILDSLRHFVLNAGVDGFRFDLAPILGRTESGYDRDAALLQAICNDTTLSDRILIAEPWDIGANGYQLGNFPAPFLEWNDRYRDDVRRFWRGDRHTVGDLATRLAGSSDVYGSAEDKQTRTLNFICAHDGFTLGDMVRYERKHNEANGEQNRDGHNENFSWNNGVEGETKSEKVNLARRADIKALAATLFASRGSIMFYAGDEFGRTQLGNNNAYAQDNATTWVDWGNRDLELEAYFAELAQIRARFPVLREQTFLVGDRKNADVEWLSDRGDTMRVEDWEDPTRHRLTMVLASNQSGKPTRIAVVLNGERKASRFKLPSHNGKTWRVALSSKLDAVKLAENGAYLLDGRTVTFFEEIDA